MEIAYETTIGNKYMILNRLCIDKDFFDEKMYLKADIPHLIKADIRYMNNMEYYYYNVNNKVSLREQFKDKTIKSEDLLTLFLGISLVKNILTEYLLSGESILLSPDCIYINETGDKIYFCFYPGYKNNLLDNFMELSTFLLDRIDHDNELCNQIVYEYYENVSKEIYGTEKYIELLKESILKDEELQITEEIVSYQDNSFEEQFYFSEPEINEKIDDNREILVPLVVCAAIILISAIIYMSIFINQDILSFLGISTDTYIVIGAALAFIISIVIFFIIKLYIKRTEKIEQELIAIEEEKYQKRMNPGTMEKKEYEIRNNKNYCNQ